MLNVAIIGAGNIGRIRAGVVERSPESRVAMIADVEITSARDLAQAHGAEATADWEAAAQSPDIDLVVVSTPTKFHAEAVKAALQAGKHVLCEKPLARTVKEAESIVGLTEQNNLVLKTGFNYRYMAHVRKAKELIASGVLGDLYFLRCRYGHGGRPGYEQHWCTDLELSGGGVLLEQGIHILDLVRYFLCEPERVLATTSRFFWNFPDVEDNCFVLLQAQSEQTAQIHVSWTQWINVFSLEIFGRDGYLHLTGRDGHYGPQKLLWGKRQPNHGRPQEETYEFPAQNDSWELEWEDFLKAVHTRCDPMGNTTDGLQALRIVEAAYKSSQDQMWVDVAPIKEYVESQP